MLDKSSKGPPSAVLALAAEEEEVGPVGVVVCRKSGEIEAGESSIAKEMGGISSLRRRGLISLASSIFLLLLLLASFSGWKKLANGSR